MPPFLELIQIAIGTREPRLERALTREEWQEVYALARKQAVLGVLSQVLERLPREQLVLGVESYLLLFAEKVREKNASMDRYAAKLTVELDGMGFRSCILKGQGVSRLYPDPGLRQCGDIDIWIEGSRRATISALRKRWKTGSVFYHHCDIYPFGKECSVEAHFCPSWMNSPLTNRRLQRWFAANAPAQFENRIPELGFSKPQLQFECSFSAIHIYRHLLHEGIGLRQLMDYYYILGASSGEDRHQAFEFMCTLGMRRFLGALMFAMQHYFRLRDEQLLCEPDSALGAFLIEEIDLSGNFGISDPRNTYRNAHGPAQRLVERMRHLRRFRALAPSEVFWAPYFKIWQYCWKIINKW